MKEKILAKIRDLYQVEVTDWIFLERPFAYPLFTAIAKTKEGKQIFVKESKNYVSFDHLEKLYTAIGPLEGSDLNLSLPIQNGRGQYGFTIEDKAFHIFDFLQVQDFNPKEITYFNLLSELKKLHEGLKKLHLPESQEVDHLDLKVWLERPLVYLPRALGENDNFEFLSLYKEFMEMTLPTITFKNSNIFWDVSKENICLTSDNKIVFLDFELTHKGAILNDYLRATSMYIEYNGRQFLLEKKIFEYLQKLSEAFASPMNEETLRFLLARCLIRNVRGGLLEHEKSNLKDYLNSLIEFINN